MSQALQLPLTPLSQAEAFFSLLYGSHMRPFPRRRVREKVREHRHDPDRQWIFLGSKEQMKSMATLETLYAVLRDQSKNTTYYTPNGYYRRDQRLTETLRWLNAFVFDLDTKGETLDDVFDRTDRAGLPRPTAVIQTPGGGYHVCYFFSQSLRATPKTIVLYTAIMEHIATDIGADLFAVGANRIFRTPNEKNLVFMNAESRADFDTFKKWRELNHPYDPARGSRVFVQTNTVMESAAMQRLLSSPCATGCRDQTCFTLALGMKAAGWSIEAAEHAIADWHSRFVMQGGKEPFTLRDAMYKVSYVYRKENLHAPSAEVIRELSGLPFSYARKAAWESAKPRDERSRSHLREWKADLTQLLQTEGELSGSQTELARQISCPLSTFKLILRELADEGFLTIETKRGRGGLTTIRWIEQSQENSQAEEQAAGEDQVQKNTPPENATVLYVDFNEKKLRRRSTGTLQIGDPVESDPGPYD